MPYAEVSKHLADASVGIVPYEESAGTHCAFVAKIVEYVASGLPSRLHATQKHPELFPKRPDGEFSEFNGEDFGRNISSLAGGAGFHLAAARRPIRRAREAGTRLAAAVPQGG